MSSLNILVISGGISHEREVSLRSGRRIADALTEAGHTVVLAEPDPELFRRILNERPDVVFPAVHGASGEDGSLLGLLELLGVAVVGSTAAAARLAWSKPAARERMREAGFAVPTGVVLTRDSFRELSAEHILNIISERASFPLVVKPGHGGSAQGVSVVSEPSELARALVEAFTYADTALCETWVAGTEVAVSVWNRGEGPEALPAVEIAPHGGVYNFEARYNAGETTFFVPARLDEEIQRRLAATALSIHQALGLGDLSRIDFIVDAEGTPWFLEANVIPGFTETSLFPLALSGADIRAADGFAALALQAAQRSR